MNDLAFGRLLRLVRARRGIRQADVAAKAGVHQATVSLVERGQLDGLTVRTVRSICAALEIEVSLDPRWRGPALDRLRDAAHASIVERVAFVLRARGWEVVVEFSFNRYGERGSVDLVGWHAPTRTLLIVEVKTALVDLQDLLGTLDRKRRVVPLELARERGWRATQVGVILAARATSSSRRIVQRHAATFGAALPSSNRRGAPLARKPGRRAARDLVCGGYAW